MTKRFFKLLYVFALIGISLGMLIYILVSIDYENVVWNSYKAKCISNGQYIVLQGSSENDPWVFDEVSYNDTIFNDIKRDLNFYCKYDAIIQSHIDVYNKARTSEEVFTANTNFWRFKDSVIDSVSIYPPLYKLELVDREFQPYKIYGPIIDGIFMALGLFVLLQILRMSYVYVVFGKVIWHPFKKITH